MIWNRNLDEKIKEAGWLLDKKDDHGITYKKERYTGMERKSKVVEIRYNQISIYTKDEVLQNKTEPARLRYKELELFSKKFKQMKKEYGWK